MLNILDRVFPRSCEEMDHVAAVAHELRDGPRIIAFSIDGLFELAHFELYSKPKGLVRSRN